MQGLTPLFQEKDLSRYLATHQAQIVAKIGRMSLAQFQDISMEALARQIMGESRVEPLELLKEQATGTPEHVKYDPQRPTIHHGDYYRVTFVLPYQGNTELWYLAPNVSTSMTLLGVIDAQKQTVSIAIEFKRDDPEYFRREWQRKIEHMEIFIRPQAISIESFNNELSYEVKKALESRRLDVTSTGKLDRLMKGIGVPQGNE